MSTNLRNKPIDKRYLSPSDRELVSGRRAQALAKTRARRGQAAYQYSRPKSTTKRYKGNNAFAPGIRAQQARMQQLSADKQAQKALRPANVPNTSLF